MFSRELWVANLKQSSHIFFVSKDSILYQQGSLILFKIVLQEISKYLISCPTVFSYIKCPVKLRKVLEKQLPWNAF